jgi:hypothetical protein
MRERGGKLWSWEHETGLIYMGLSRSSESAESFRIES